MLIFKFIKLLWEVITMAKKPKNQLSGSLQILINEDALNISLKEITIDNTPKHKVYRGYVLDECKERYNCDGYGEPLQTPEE